MLRLDKYITWDILTPNAMGQLFKIPTPDTGPHTKGMEAPDSQPTPPSSPDMQVPQIMEGTLANLAQK